jgi:hypothetical protein
LTQHFAYSDRHCQLVATDRKRQGRLGHTAQDTWSETIGEADA